MKISFLVSFISYIFFEAKQGKENFTEQTPYQTQNCRVVYMLNWEDLKARKTLKNGSMEAACEQYEILQISFDTFANVLRNQHLQRRKSNAFHSAGKSLMLHIYINDIGDWAPVIYASRLVRYHLSKG